MVRKATVKEVAGKMCIVPIYHASMQLSRCIARARVLLTILVSLLVVFQLALHPLIFRAARKGSWDKDAHQEQFRRHWCKVQEQRTDWFGLLAPCQGQLAWRSRRARSSNRTDAKNSFVSFWDLKPAGHFSRFFIQSVTSQGIHKTFGGDSWKVYMREGPASLAPVVLDLNNGTYEVLFLPLEPGFYTAQVWLDYTLCDGLREPPADWFIHGTDYSTYRDPQDGFLGYIGEDHVNQHLQGKLAEQFSVPGSSEECPNSISLRTEQPSVQCDDICPDMLWDGHGRWLGGQWKPYFDIGPVNKGPTIGTRGHVKASGTFWIYGDSLGLRLLKSIRSRPLCTEIFQKCEGTYNWIYEVKDKTEPPRIASDFNQSIILNHIRDILKEPSMNNPESVFLFNLGVHFPISITFEVYRMLIDSVIRLLKERHFDGELKYKAMPIWKTTTAIEKEKVTRWPWPARPLNFTMFRFLTPQRIQLFNTYAMQAMCQAGIPVLDLFPLSASYVNGTLDYVHYDSKVFRPVEDFLQRYFGESKSAESFSTHKNNVKKVKLSN